jgi:hypothetical protein
LIALLVSASLLPAAWRACEVWAGPVAWAEKSLYLQATRDLVWDSLASVVPGTSSSAQGYAVLVAGPPGKETYLTDAMLNAGVRGRVSLVYLPAAQIRRGLDRWVYRGRYWRLFLPLLIDWTLCAAVLCSVGWQMDLRR